MIWHLKCLMSGVGNDYLKLYAALERKERFGVGTGIIPGIADPLPLLELPPALFTDLPWLEVAEAADLFLEDPLPPFLNFHLLKPLDLFNVEPPVELPLPAAPPLFFPYLP